jgi:hypothetical protein
MLLSLKKPTQIEGYLFKVRALELLEAIFGGIAVELIWCDSL